MPSDNELTRHTKRIVADRDLDVHNDTCCAFCKDPITIEQDLTFQHILPRSMLGIYERERLCDTFNITGEKRQAMMAQDDELAWKEYFDHPDNLCAMHASCHATADHGRYHSPEDAYELNRQHARHRGDLDTQALALAVDIMRSDEMPRDIKYARMAVVQRASQLIAEHSKHLEGDEQAQATAKQAQVQSTIDRRLAKAATYAPVVYSLEEHPPGRMNNPNAAKKFLATATDAEKTRWLANSLRSCAPYRIPKVMQHFSDDIRQQALQLIQEKVTERAAELNSQAETPTLTVSGEKRLIRATRFLEDRLALINSFTQPRSNAR